MSLWFDVLFFGAALLTLVALAQRRTATFVVLGNHLPPLRALSRIAEFGPPVSQNFVPASVFSNENLEIAAWLLTLSLTVALVAALVPAARRPAEALPAVPRWLLWSLVPYFLVVIFSSRSIVSYGYTDPARSSNAVNLSGASALINSIVLYEVVRRVRVGLWRPATGFLFILVLFLLTDYAKGSTGLATGYVVTATLLCFSQEERLWPRLRGQAAALSAVLLLVIAIRGVRSTFAYQGAEALSAFAETVSTKESGGARNAEGFEFFGNGVQYAAHLLECVSLYEAGVSREWRSIYSPIEYTFKPSFLLGPLGLKRSREAPWELGDYYIHGGGIYVIGELYWNGGYLCAAVMLSAIFWFCRRIDTGSRRSFIWLTMVCHFTPSLLQGFGYGFSQVSRGAINGLLALLVWSVGRRLHFGAPRPSDVGDRALRPG
jgi:hypothetical protein